MISPLLSTLAARFRHRPVGPDAASLPDAPVASAGPTLPWPRRRFLRFTALGAGAALTARAVTPAAPPTTSPSPRAPRFPVSDHCDGRVFFNPGPPMKRNLGRLLRWKMGNTAKRWPAQVEITPQLPPPMPGGNRIAVTWIGHATFLLRTSQGTFLTDPVWSERAGPLTFGPKRAHAPGVRFDDLPKVDYVLLSHDHYDHCDVVTLRRLAERDAPRVIAPLGHRDLLEASRHHPDKIIELDWWQSLDPTTGKIVPLPDAKASSAAKPSFAAPLGFRITLTPARHWSNRVTGSLNGRLWGGFFLNLGETSAWFAGDTGYDEQFFRAIRERLGAPQLGIIPIGAYEPRWFMAPMHCNPAEAVQIHQDIGARRSFGMHWGTFQLTDEGRDEPPQALAAALNAAGLSTAEFGVLAPGASQVV
jgi:L-ascorbate metabolism protein UlaG (beta-lactamase superfamily)